MKILKLALENENHKFKKGVVEKMNSLNPMQIVNKVEIPIMIYEVKYEYTTVRGNKKQGTKYFICNTYNPQLNMKNELDNYIRQFNIDNPKRQLSNVKFLESSCLGYSAIS